MSASTGHGGNDGDLNADGLIDSDQSAVATMAWIKADYFQAAVDGTLTKVTPIVYIAAEPSSSHVQADYEYQLSNIDVKPLIDPAFGGTSAIKLQNAAGEEVLNAWDPLQFVLKPNINTNTQHLNDIDPVRSGTQVKVLIDISRANATLTSLNAYLKFVPQTTIDAAHSANINLLDLDGKPITTEGWYDFTQHRDAKGQWTGDGAHFITDGIDIKAIELTLTDNAFGDDDMSVDRILDPGTPVLKSSRQPVSIISKNTVIADPEVDNITLANVTSSGIDCVPSVLLGSVKNNGKPVNSNATGNALNNSLSGNDGNNILDGGLGNDVLKGESGNDTLVGGQGADILTGGEGKDVFKYNDINESAPTAYDVITDFSVNDKLDLRKIDANPIVSGDQKFKFIQANSFSKQAGELRFSAGMLTADVDGDGQADFAVKLIGVEVLNEADILL